MSRWDKSRYNLTTKRGKSVVIDVTMSVNPNLGPNLAITEVIEFFHRRNVTTILDFGAGALRHSLPLLADGFEVCAVDFEEQYLNIPAKKICVSNLRLAEASPNFSKLVYPRAFIDDKRKFHAAMLCYTFQGMPLKTERDYVLRLLYDKLKGPGCIVWMSRWDNLGNQPVSQRVEDGIYKYPHSPVHSFYREFNNDDVREMMENVGWRKKFYRVRSLGRGGKDQIFVYAKRRVPW
jgi:serine/threonine-protein kinase RIO1